MKKPIFISGPHGSGKTTLIDKLLSNYGMFVENSFDIDFISQFPSIKTLSHFERCLLRLYHRIYISYYADQFAQMQNGKVTLVSRGIYDSEAYINVYKEYDWITGENSNTLDFILRNNTYTPYTIVLNPPVEVIMQRLEKRIETGVRGTRDKVFKIEDTYEFVKSLHNQFMLFKNRKNILYIEDNTEKEVEAILHWIEEISRNN
ncbi:deoxynucleoside kinase [Paenibacillus allorhizosphaerae]|uniref:deoxynucleoside kinase n=1 Tax=Paenibacillus allorhizosphaerae TaxID=2849866 RepID=UPI00361B9365